MQAFSYFILLSSSSSSSTNYSHNMQNTSYEESDEADYGYGGHSKGYDEYSKGYDGHSKGYDGQGEISLGALKYHKS